MKMISIYLVLLLMQLMLQKVSATNPQLIYYLKMASLTINIPVVFAIKVLMLTSRQSSAQHVLNGSTENVMVPLLRNTKS